MIHITPFEVAMGVHGDFEKDILQVYMYQTFMQMNIAEKKNHARSARRKMACYTKKIFSIQLFRERLFYKRGKAYATMSKVIMGNGGFYGCLSEPQCVSAWWKETAQTRIPSFSFLVAESP